MRTPKPSTGEFSGANCSAESLKAELFDGVFQLLVKLVAFREKAGVDKRLDIFIARQLLAGWIC